MVGFVQEYQAESIVVELKKTLALTAMVVRDGNIIEVDTADVVPGDILKVEEVLHMCNLQSCSTADLNPSGNDHSRGRSTTHYRDSASRSVLHHG